MELWNKMTCLQAFWMSRQPVEVKAANGTHKKGHFSGEANKRISSSIAYWRKIRSSWEQLPALTGPTVLFDAWCQGLLDVNLIESSRTCDLCVWVREQAIKDANGHAAVKPDLTLDQLETDKIQKKMGQSFHNLFNYLSKTKSSAQQPFCFSINWELGQNIQKGVSAELKTCNRKQFGVARRQVYMLLPPSSTMLCHLSNMSTDRKVALSDYVVITKWHFHELNLTTT